MKIREASPIAQDGKETDFDQIENWMTLPGSGISRRSFLCSLGALALSACGGDGGESLLGANTRSIASSTTGATTVGRAAAAASPMAFVHPGLLHTQSDFDRMNTKVATQASPWIDDWKLMLSKNLANTSWTPNPQSIIYRGSPSGNNWWYLAWDVEAAYIDALRWKIQGDMAAADRAVKIMNAWSGKLTQIWWADGYYDGFLVAGIQGYKLANVGEIMRSYSGWAPADFASFQSMMKNIFYPMNSGITNLANPSSINVYSNWDLCATAAVMAIGVLCDDSDMFNAAVTYFKQGQGNGGIAQMVYFTHPGYLGQTQESGRDQGHNTLSITLVSSICEMAWNQGIDLYGYDNNRVLSGCEYVAKGNQIQSGSTYYSMPFMAYSNQNANDTQFSTASQGIKRPEWALVYNHYVNRQGIAAPYSEKFAALVAPEGSDDYPANGGFDLFGFGTLTCLRDPIAKGAPPSGLSAVTTSGQVVLSWWGTAYATSYTVKRATVSGGPYAVVASGISDLLTYTDAGLAAGTYYYVVTATAASGETAASNEVQAVVGISLDTRLPFGDGSGTIAADTSGHGNNATLQGGAAWATDSIRTAVSLNGSSAYVSLPDDIVKTTGDFTISAWVYWNGGQTWARIFDFGSSFNRYMFLTPNSNTGKLRFATSLNQGWTQSVLEGPSALPSKTWVHVAVTQSGSTATLYVNGAAVASNSAMLFSPFQIGHTTQNWVGRSQFPHDPYFSGKIADFRIYRGQLSASQVAALAAG